MLYPKEIAIRKLIGCMLYPTSLENVNRTRRAMVLSRLPPGLELTAPVMTRCRRLFTLARFTLTQVAAFNSSPEVPVHGNCRREEHIAWMTTGRAWCSYVSAETVIHSTKPIRKVKIFNSVNLTIYGNFRSSVAMRNRGSLILADILPIVLHSK